MDTRTLLVAGATGIVGNAAVLPDCQDTEDAILYWLTRMRQARLLPRAPDQAG